MAQAIYCQNCEVYFTAELRGKSCPACGDELVHLRVPAGARNPFKKKKTYASRAVWDHILKKDICPFCKQRQSTTIDHIQPKALGGSKGSWTNRTGACFECNQAKKHTPLLFFLLQQDGSAPDWLWDGDSNWPIPCWEEKLPLTIAEEESAHEFHADPRKFIFQKEDLDE